MSCLSAQDVVERENIAALSHNLRSDNRSSGAGGLGIVCQIGAGGMLARRRGMGYKSQNRLPGLVWVWASSSHGLEVGLG